MNVLLVAAGGAIGSSLRYLVGTLFIGAAWPFATFLVNIVGCMAIGVLAGWGLSTQARLFWITGVLGGFTTFSAFSLETVMLWERAPWQGIAYVLASVGIGLAAFALGWALARS